MAPMVDKICDPRCKLHIAFIRYDLQTSTFNHWTSYVYHCVIHLSVMLWK